MIGKVPSDSEDSRRIRKVPNGFKVPRNRANKAETGQEGNGWYKGVLVEIFTTEGASATTNFSTQALPFLVRFEWVMLQLDNNGNEN